MPAELGEFDECFITGTAAEVTPVGEIGPHSLQAGGDNRGADRRLYRGSEAENEGRLTGLAREAGAILGRPKGGSAMFRLSFGFSSWPGLTRSST